MDRVTTGSSADQKVAPVAPFNRMTITEMLSLLPLVSAVFTIVYAIYFVEISSWHSEIASASESSSQIPSEAMTKYLSNGLTVYFTTWGVQISPTRVKA